MAWRCSALTPIAALVLCAMLLAWWTLGFRAFTSFSAARVGAGELPRTAPLMPLVDERGERWELGAPSERYRLVQPMYLNCPDACPIAMSGINQLIDDLSDLIPSRLNVVSVSVAHDSPDALHKMWTAHGAPVGWSMASLTNASLTAELAQLGVWMFRRPDGLINHSLDLWLIDPAGDVVDVFSPDEEKASVARSIRERIR